MASFYPIQYLADRIAGGDVLRRRGRQARNCKQDDVGVRHFGHALGDGVWFSSGLDDHADGDDPSGDAVGPGIGWDRSCHHLRMLAACAADKSGPGQQEKAIKASWNQAHCGIS